MTQREVIAIVKESRLWESLTQKERQEAIKYALKNNQPLMTEQDIKTTVGEVYLDLR